MTTTYVCTWQIMDTMKVPCMTYFGSMTRDDDLKEAGPVELLGRWSNVGQGSGWCVCRATNYSDVADWLYNWAPMCNISIKVMCDDNVARQIINGEEPSWKVEYNTNDEAQEGENLYVIDYTFAKDKKMDGYKVFAGLTEEQDKADAGNCRPLCRYHDLGTGVGIAVCGARSEADLFAWAFNWAAMCECKITPVLTDTQTRKIIAGKPDFQQKLEAVKAQMGA